MVRLIAKNVKTTIVGQFDTDNNANEQYHENLRKELSYMVAEADYSSKFKENKWDGRISLYHKRTQTFPSGLMSQVVKWLKEEQIDYKFVDERYRPERDANYSTRFAEFNRELRFYQTEACRRGEEATRGIFSIATGGGKTLLSCELISQLKVAPFLFIVPSQSLLEQTRKEFSKFILQDGEVPHIGMIGDGVCDINPTGINVATYQSLLAAHDERYQEKSSVDPITKRRVGGNRIVQVPEKERKSLVQLEAEEKEAATAYNRVYQSVQVKYQSELHIAEQIKKDSEREKKVRVIERKIDKECKQYRENLVKARTAIKTRQKTLTNQSSVRELCLNVSGFIVDEAHMAAVIIEALGEKMHRAFYRFGLSATPFREDNQEIRINGTMGKKLIEVSASDLIELGFLVPPYIFMVRNNYTEQTETWSETYSKQIVNCWQRNYRIKQFAEEFKEAGYPTLILVEQKEHGYLLESMIKDSVFVPGSAKGDEINDNPDDVEKSYRRLMLDATERNEIILIATQWANVGVDAPRLMALILAGSNKSAVTTYQQVGRILRTVGKNYEESVMNRKALAIVIDFMEEQRILHKHSIRRKKVYQRERAWNVSVVG
jgi:superfamily II DNA or RNA helicase